MTDNDRQSTIVDCLVQAFKELVEADPDAFRTKFRTKFRKMAAEPFAFYRAARACSMPSMPTSQPAGTAGPTSAPSGSPPAWP